jgi:hypothetical protein
VPARMSVKEAQKLMGQLGAAHTKALGRLESTMARRREVLAEQDQLVIAAESGVRDSVAARAAGVGPELAATLLGMDLGEVRRLTKVPSERQADRAG